MCYIGKFSLCTFGTGILIVGKIVFLTILSLYLTILTFILANRTFFFTILSLNLIIFF